MKNSISLYIILLILVFVAVYFINQNLSYWNFKYKHKEVVGKIIEVTNIREDNYKIKYSFYSSEMSKERIRTIDSQKKFFIGEAVVVMYNPSFPNYVEIKEIDTSLNLYRTILPVLITVLCVLLILLGMFGKIDLNKLS